MNRIKIEASHLTKQFKMYRRPAGRLAEWLTFGQWQHHEVFTALSDISFTLRQGEFFGIVGPNGSGKSTLLKVLTQVLSPTSGSFHIEGRVTSLLELGTGFNPELTGRQNIVNSARLLGFSEDYVLNRMEEMIQFADIGHYAEQPVKYYSSGMLVRLAFSIFAHVEPDVFIIDEALSVGDVYFSQKCFQRLDKMRSDGCTLLFVSHDLAAVRKYCDHALYLHHGCCRFMGSAIEATDMYLESVSPGGAARQLAPQSDGIGKPSIDVKAVKQEVKKLRDSISSDLADAFDEATFMRVRCFTGARIGTGDVSIVALKICDDGGRARDRFSLNDRIHVQILADVRNDVERATVSVQIANRMGIVVWGTNHERLSGEAIRLSRGTWTYAHFVLEPGLGVDEYTLDIGYGDASGEGHVFDRLTAATRIEIAPEGHQDFVGLARIPCQCEIHTVLK